MSSTQTVIITTTKSKTQFESLVSPNDADTALQDLINYLTAVNGGIERALIDVEFGAVQSTGTLTVSSTGSTATQACTIANITLTGVAATPSTDEFVVSTTPATQAANMAAAINLATNSFTGIVTATSALGVVTITASVPGVEGDATELDAGDLANVVAAAFSGGSDGDTLTIDKRG